MQMAQGRIPHVYFEDREDGEDVVASAELKYSVPKMKTFIFIVAHGSKDAIEFDAHEFVTRKKQEALQGRYDLEWAKSFEQQLAMWKEGKILPRSGTPTINWERIAKKRREELARMFPTLEDIAAVPDGSLNMIGMDGRVIREYAIGDIQAKKDLSPIVKELADTKEDNRRLQEQMDLLLAQQETMRVQLAALSDDTAPRRGRPPKE